jgi:hypothetical protein
MPQVVGGLSVRPVILGPVRGNGADGEWTMSKSVWRVPWTAVRHGTEYEEGDVEHNENWANVLLDGCLDLWADVIAATSDDTAERYAQGVAVMDDVLIAFDMLGWKVVCKDDPQRSYPILRRNDFAPDWCE